MKLQLPNLTIWSCVWTPEPDRIERHLRVLKYCQSIIDCQRIVLFSALEAPAPNGIDLVTIPITRDFNWNVFVNRQVPRLVSSEFAMSVHEDGFPIRPDLWSDDFLKYDYIGAPWPDGTVGNGGFNIESLKLMRMKLTVPVGKYELANSDAWTCKVHRERLERKGVTFAPTNVAARFSTESAIVNRPAVVPSFGFHGRRNEPEKYAEGWRLIEESEKLVPEPPPLKIVVVYVYAPKGRDAVKYTTRFLESYRNNPPGIDHETIVVLNGVKQSPSVDRLFRSLPNCRFLEHDNSGYDIGGFQHAARDYPCDMMVFFGNSTYFQRPGWLTRMRSAFLRHGNAQYGTMGNRGNLSVKVWPHIRTTAFWMRPQLMASYPKIITRPEDRHPFEHGQDCFTAWVTKQGLKSWVVTWTNELLWEDWDSDPNGYSRGDQSNMLVGDRMCEPPYFYATEAKTPMVLLDIPNPVNPNLVKVRRDTAPTFNRRPHQTRAYRVFNP